MSKVQWILGIIVVILLLGVIAVLTLTIKDLKVEITAIIIEYEEKLIKANKGAESIEDIQEKLNGKTEEFNKLEVSIEERKMELEKLNDSLVTVKEEKRQISDAVTFEGAYEWLTHRNSIITKEGANFAEMSNRSVIYINEKESSIRVYEFTKDQLYKETVTVEFTDKDKAYTMLTKKTNEFSGTNGDATSITTDKKLIWENVKAIYSLQLTETDEKFEVIEIREYKI